MLISQRADDVRDREREWDLESVGGASDVEVNEVVEPTVAEIPVVMEEGEGTCEVFRKFGCSESC